MGTTRAYLEPRQPAADVVLLTPQEAAALARVRPRTVYDWIKRDLLRPLHAGRQLRIERGELQRFLLRSMEA